jgi:quercetin dioxygenase-like cupin family protein
VETVTNLLVRPEVGQSIWLGGVGVECKVPAEMTQGSLSIVEHPVLPRTLVPPHVHHGEDELSIVLEGRFGVRIGPDEFEAGLGAYVFKPRDIPHTFWNATDEPARLIELIWPGGFERFFDELGAAYRDGDGTPAPDRVATLAKRYNVEFLMDWAPELESKYGVSLIHQGGR